MEQAKDNPFKTNQFAEIIGGIHTEFILTSYDNYLFFTITQLGKLGTIIKAECDESMDPEQDQSFSISTLLGKRDDFYELCARSIIEITSAASKKPLILALALKEPSIQNLKAISQTIKGKIEVPKKTPLELA